MAIVVALSGFPYFVMLGAVSLIDRFNYWSKKKGGGRFIFELSHSTQCIIVRLQNVA
jgi:hypothetical protein